LIVSIVIHKTTLKFESFFNVLILIEFFYKKNPIFFAIYMFFFAIYIV